MQDYADLCYSMSMCLHEVPTKAMTPRYGRTWVHPVRELPSDWQPCCLSCPACWAHARRATSFATSYSGEELVPVRSGRWWEVGSTPFEGARIKEWRPHWSILHKSHAEDAALYGSEAEKWKHNPILHPDLVGTSFYPIRHLRDSLP
jgi:hypothetical protein